LCPIISGDTIFDSIEGSLDTDGDSVPNFLDLDSDGDTILDSYELDVDTDGDSIGDFLDSDSDNDSIPDAIEGVFDLDGDTIANFRDLDSDSDGIPDKVEGFVDNDNDNIPDRLDFDSDNDCLPDRIEGSPNYRVYNSFACAQDTPLSPADTDGDTLLDSFEGYTDVDGDGVPNYLDLDSDGTYDIIEHLLIIDHHLILSFAPSNLLHAIFHMLAQLSNALSSRCKNMFEARRYVSAYFLYEITVGRSGH
jgi:hypothetical protein